MPIFVASPSVDEKVAEPFDSTFGYPEARALVRELLVGGDTRSIVEVLERKATEVVRVLAAQRKRGDTLQSDDWTHLAAESSGSRKARWLVNKEMGWRKKLGLKTVTATFRGLLRAAGEVGCVAVGSQDMPLCIIDASKRSTFGAEAAELYGKKISPEFQAWLSSPGKPLLCIWVAGFKPRGDDSRPDRGLIPLGRMLFGFGDVDLLTIVYGPAQPATWRLLERDMWGLARINGLWEAIVGLSEGILVDSPTGTGMQRVGLVVSPPSRSSQLPSTLSAASEVPNFSEHDVDSTLHLVFSGSVLQGVFEAMCNPPGGDWSGLAYHSFASAQEYKWTSLPRVSRGGGKRPDHVIEFALSSGAETILSIESKDLMQTLETGVGPRLTKYVEDLLAVAPTVSRPDAVGIWRPYQGRKIYPLPRIISGAAIRYSLPDELSKALKTGKVDVSFGVEFLPLEERVVVHVLAKPHTAWLGQKMVELTKRFDGRIIVQIH